MIAGRTARSWLVSAARALGVGIAILAIVLCIRAIVLEWPLISSSVRGADLGWLALGFVLSLLSMGWLGLLWQRCLAAFGEPTPIGATIAWYFAGELGKYVPGGVWAVLGRGEFARRDAGVPRATAYATTLVSYGTMCLSASAVCIVILPWVVAGGEEFGWYASLLLLVPVGLVVVHPTVFGRVLSLAHRITGGRVALEPAPWGTMVALVIWGMPAWAFLGLAACCVTAALGFTQSPSNIAFAAVAAWILGFLLFPVPAGAGVREIIFLALSSLPAGPGAAVAVIARFLLLLADGIGGLLGMAVTARRLQRGGLRYYPDDADTSGETS